MNFTPDLKYIFWKHAFFPIQIKSKQTPAKLNLIYLVNLHFSSILAKSYYSLSYIFDIGKIIEDEINKSNDPLFKFEKTLKYENNEISNSLRRSLSCVKFLGSTKMQEKYVMHDDLVFNIPNCKFGMLQTYHP